MHIETISYWLYYPGSIDNVYLLSLVLVCVFFLGSFGSLISTDRLLVKYSHFKLIKIVLTIEFFAILSIPVLVFFSLQAVAFVFFSISIFGIDFLMPVGPVMISESTDDSSRKKTIETSDMLCIAFKGLGGFIGLFLLSFIGTSSFSYFGTAIGFALLFLMSLKIPKYFPLMADCH